MKVIYRIGADVIWLLHLFVVVIVLLGWLFPSVWWLYIAILVGTLVSELVLSYCVLSKWEFDLRKKVNPSITYDFTYASYYTYRLTQGHLSPNFLRYAGIAFTSFSLFINFYFAL